MIRAQIYLPDILYRDIKRRAKAQNQPAAQIIRAILEQGLYDTSPDIVAEQPRETWRQASQRLAIKGGPKDLSRHIDDYLYGDKQ